MELSTVLAAVPAVSASVAVITALTTWWKARTWSSLNDARELLRKVSDEKNTLIGDEIANAAAKAAAVVTIELTARAQQRAKKVAARNGTVRFILVTIAIDLGFLAMALICTWGLILGIGGTSLGASNLPPWAAVVYFGVFGVASVLGGVMGTKDRIQIWRRTSNKRALYKEVAKTPGVKQMEDGAPARA